MATVTEVYAGGHGRFVTLCDCTPPRGADPAALDAAAAVGADIVCVAYNPGKLPRADSVAAAATLRARTGAEVVVNLATRDMNRLALQSRIMGARMLGIENVVVLQGDPFTAAEMERVSAVSSVTPTRLLADIAALNAGNDYRGSALRTPVDICAGASFDVARGVEREAALTHRKVAAGAQFLIAQPFFDPALRQRFLDAYAQETGSPLAVPVFWGVQALDRDGIVLADVPEETLRELQAGRPGAEIAAEQLRALADDGVRGVYLVPPILRGGARDYAAAREALALAA